MNQNLFLGTGRLARNPVFHPATAQSQERCSFTLVINRTVTSEKEGPQADYLPCVLWGNLAQKFVEECSKGDEIDIVARWRTRPLSNGSEKTLFYEFRVETYNLICKALRNLGEAHNATYSGQAVRALIREFTDE